MIRELAAHLRSRPPRLGPVRLVAVDGPSGAGKTHFARRLAEPLRAPTVHTDDLLDGWDDQFSFWERLEKQVLGPLRRGETAAYQRYDWTSGRFAGPAVQVPRAPVVLLEGVSAARREIRAELSFVVFVDAAPDLRLARAIARDSDDSLAYRQYLERWRAAEERHFAVDRTAAYAQLLVDGGNDARRTGWFR